MEGKDEGGEGGEREEEEGRERDAKLLATQRHRCEAKVRGICACSLGDFTFGAGLSISSREAPAR